MSETLVLRSDRQTSRFINQHCWKSNARLEARRHNVLINVLLSREIVVRMLCLSVKVTTSSTLLVHVGFWSSGHLSVTQYPRRSHSYSQGGDDNVLSFSFFLFSENKEESPSLASSSKLATKNIASELVFLSFPYNQIYS